MIKTKKSDAAGALSDRNQRSDTKHLLKKELLDVFKKFGYLSELKDYEVTFRTTSGNIAWININSIETIK